MSKYKTVDEYIRSFPADVQRILEKMRQIIHEAVPEASEVISYSMPAYRLNRILVYFAVHRNHIGFYPTASGIAAFRNELASYKTSKGAVQFPFSKPIPYDLVTKIVKFRSREDLQSPNEIKHLN